jgi:hypothetical protein
MGARNVLFNAGWRASRTASGSSAARALTRPLGGAAIRVPERLGAQLALVIPSSSPKLFVHEGARQALERRFRGAFPGTISLSITDNRQSMISASRTGSVLRVRLHHMFLDAPSRVADALVRYVTAGDRNASDLVGAYIESNIARLARRRRGVPLFTKGDHHDLYAVFQYLNDRYFGGAVNAVVTWGPRRKVRSNRRVTIKLGSYNALDRLIRVHPALDRKWVPRYFISYVVYHEMLHHVIPASRGAGRRMLHPSEFLERERAFRWFDRALAWERRNIGRLLRMR